MLQQLFAVTPNYIILILLWHQVAAIFMLRSLPRRQFCHLQNNQKIIQDA